VTGDRSEGSGAFLRWAAGLAVAAVVVALWAYLGAPKAPYSTPIVFVDEPGPPPAAPGDLPAPANPDGPRLRLGFVGDVMQHGAQADDDFRASYAPIAPLIQGFDLAVGNLEFPVHQGLPVGPGPSSVRFNGSPEHLDALAEAGFDLLSMANNHAYDRGLEGLGATLDELERRNLTPLGAARSLEGLGPVVRDVGAVRLAFQAYTFAPNAYADEAGERDWPPRTLPLFELHFPEWRDEFRAEGLALFREHVAEARAGGADLVVAFLHWGAEWHFQPTGDQRLAAHDMIDAGFDLVVGSHSHVLNGPEVYRGRLIAYSLGNFISDFRPLEARTGAVLEVEVASLGPQGAVVVDFAFYPVLGEGPGHVVAPVGPGSEGEGAKAWALAKRILGEGAMSLPGG
jgi:poly-gamma-glutamate synthesis protein (capsule biosynthesis protein)